MFSLLSHFATRDVMIMKFLLFIYGLQTTSRFSRNVRIRDKYYSGTKLNVDSLSETLSHNQRLL